MTIDVHEETLLTMSQAARTMRPKDAKPLAASTVLRWDKHGARGVRLETVVIGGTRHTSREAISRFVEATTESREPIIDKSGTEERSDKLKERLEKAGLMAS